MGDYSWDSPRDADGNLIPTPFVSRGKDNLKNFLETGYTLSNNVSVTSSTEKTTFRVNLGYDYPLKGIDALSKEDAIKARNVILKGMKDELNRHD